MSVTIDGAGSLIGVDQGLNIVGLTTLTGGIILDDSISHIGDTNTKIRFPAADTITAETGGTERLRISSAGLVGIGEVTPETLLHLSKNGGQATITLEDPSNSMKATLSAGTTRLDIGTPGSHAISLFTNNTHRFRIKSDGAAYFSGNLGLGGQTSPSAAIHLHNFSNDGYELKVTGNAVQFKRSSNSYIDQLHDTGSILFRMTSNNTEAMRIMPDGTVKIGTGTGNPILMLSASTSGTSVIQMGDTADNNIGQIWYVNSDDSMRFFSNNAERLRIDSSGHISQGGGATPSSTNGGIGLKYGIKSAANNIIIGETTSSSHNGLIIESRQTGRSGGARCSQIIMGDGVINFETAVSGADVTERLRINSSGFFNFNQANNNNLMGRVTIFDGGNFSTNSVTGSGDSDNIYLISDATSGYNVYGSSIAWSRVQYADRRVAAIANVQTSVDEDHVGLAFFTHSSADATANIEEKFRITHDGIHVTNGVSNFYVAFRLANNQSYNWDIAVPNEGGYGNSFRVEAGYNHYYTTSYGAHRSAWVSTRGTSSNVMFEQDQGHSQSGYWSFSKPNNTTFRVSKSAGSYGGQGYGFIHVRFNYF